MNIDSRVLVWVILMLSYSSFAQQSIMGFQNEDQKAQLELEKRFDSHLKAENIRNWMQQMSSRPHHVGSPFGKENAEFMVKQFKSWGYEAELATYHVLFPTPKVRLVEMIAPTKYTAKLTQPALSEDATSGQSDEQLPSYNAFSIDGDVTADLVYVNYGVPADYEALDRLGIDVKGKIVIARYFGSWRGIKPKLAAEKGAIGCILYSDPADDGYRRGDVYPKGAFKSEFGVQRGSVMDMPLYPGDPLTPGYGATKNAKRLDRNEAPTLTKIPVLPISYDDAMPLLAALSGPVVPNNWKGALPITYHVGPGPAQVHLKLEFNWDITPAYNVVATMKGSELPDQWIIRGNHHDAWVNGASDPISGMVALMEEARAVSELVKTGWKPKRTIMYCGWDAEEPGLIGSTEWAEDHADELKQKTVAYINTDGSGRGYLGISGSHSLEKFASQVAVSVTDPQTGVTVAERRRARDILNGGWDNYKGFRIGALGSGSDYTPFIQHLGIASLNVGFGGENAGGEYHTIYDSFDHYKRFKDPEFAYGVALAQVTGHSVLRLANAQLLPFEFQHFYRTVSQYAEEVIAMPEKMRKKAEGHNAMLDENIFDLANDPRNPVQIPERKKEVPFLNFAPLQNALSELESLASEVNKALQGDLSDQQLARINALLFTTERKLTKDHGLPRRPWFKHHIYAPGFYTGYGVKTLPGVREAIEQEDWEEAQEQVEVLAGVLGGYNDQLKEILQIAKQ